MLLILATSLTAVTLTREAQGERNRLSACIAYGDIKVIIYIGLSIGS